MSDYEGRISNAKPQWSWAINDNIPANNVRIHNALCQHAGELVGVGWLGPLTNLESAIIAARKLNCRDAKGCFWCLRELDHLKRPIGDLLDENLWR